jgi:hypothetical protein
VVCALHVAIAWFLLTTGRVITLRDLASSFELLLLTPAKPQLPKQEVVKPYSALSRPVSKPQLPHVIKPEQEIAQEKVDNAITPPPAVDWDAELARAARPSGIEPDSVVKDFGFPKRPPTTADYPQFDWDYARTHRVETLPQGGGLSEILCVEPRLIND